MDFFYDKNGVRQHSPHKLKNNVLILVHPKETAKQPKETSIVSLAKFDTIHKLNTIFIGLG